MHFLFLKSVDPNHALIIDFNYKLKWERRFLELYQVNTIWERIKSISGQNQIS